MIFLADLPSPLMALALLPELLAIKHAGIDHQMHSKIIISQA